MTEAARVIVVLVGGIALGLFGWIFWFLAYREACRRAREAEELLTSLAIKIQAGDVAGAVPLGKEILRRAGLVIVPKKGPPRGAP